MFREYPEVTDLYAAVEQMFVERESGTKTTLHVHRGRKAPHIDRQYFSGQLEELCGTDRYPIAIGLVKELEARGFLEGTPRWGWTDMFELHLTDSGKLWFLDEKRRREAATGRTPGKE